MTVAVFLSPTFWVAMAAVAVVALYAKAREHNPVALYAMLLLAMPLLGKPIPGIGPIEHFIGVDHSRVLALLILFPVVMGVAADPRLPRPGKLATDKAILGFFGLMLALEATTGTPLGILRIGVVYPFLDALLLYFAASRTLGTPAKLDDFKATVVLAGALLGSVAAFEFYKHWLLYSALGGHLGVASRLGDYLMRTDSVLRAMATSGQPIVLGYAMMLAIALAAGNFPRLSHEHRVRLGLFLTAGLLASVSRGPWLGAAAALLVFVACGKSTGRNLAVASGVVATIGLALSATPQGRALLAFLPFVGKVDPGSVEYRQLLFDVSLQVLMDRPFFGIYDTLSDPRLEILRQGQGIVDVVNTYIGVALSSGLVGLTWFGAAFAIPMLALAGVLHRRRTGESEWPEQARTVLAALVGVTVTIGTTSSINYIPHLYWLLLGAAVAIAHVASPSRARLAHPGRPAASRPVRGAA